MVLPLLKDLAGSIVGRYRLARRIGSDGVSDYYRARYAYAEELGEVAVRIMTVAAAARPGSSDRFIEQAADLAGRPRALGIELADLVGRWDERSPGRLAMVFRIDAEVTFAELAAFCGDPQAAN